LMSLRRAVAVEVGAKAGGSGMILQIFVACIWMALQ
jgi:hypothetical protein